MKNRICRCTTGLLVGIQLLMLLSCTAPDASADNREAVSAEEAGTLHEWERLDWRLERKRLVATYLSTVTQPPDAFRQYVKAITYSARLDSLGLDEFLALPADQQRLRRDKAGDLRDKGMRLERLVKEAFFSFQQQTGAVAGGVVRPSGACESVTRALGYFNTANGLDPSLPSSWYDAAYLSGIVGDMVRQRLALEAVLLSIEVRSDSNSEEFLDLKLRTVLDFAWLEREQGFHDRSLEWLDKADALINIDRSAAADIQTESRIIRGLLLAETGLYGQTRSIRSRVRDIKVHQRNEVVWDWPDRGIHEALKYSSDPDRNIDMINDLSMQNRVSITQMTRPWRDFTLSNDRRSWHSHDSKFASRWIKSAGLVEQRKYELAAIVHSHENFRDELPMQLNYRFWRDAGLVYELCGDLAKADEFYNYGIAYRPYYLYFPMQTYRGLARVRQLSAAGGCFIRAYEHFYVGGSLFAYAAFSATCVEIEKDPVRRRMLADQARLYLDICIRRGIRPPEALALRGFLELFLENRDAARSDLTLAHSLLLDAGRGSCTVALVAGLLTLEAKGFTAGLPMFRSASEIDPEEQQAWRLLAVAELVSGNAAEGRAALDRSLALDATDVNSLYNRGLLNWNQGDTKVALVDLRRAGELAPENEQVTALLSALENGLEASAENHMLMSADYDSRISQQEADQLARVGEGDELGLRQNNPDAGRSVDAQRLEDLEAAVAADSSRVNIRQLAVARLQNGEPERARALLLPWWDDAIEAGEIYLVLVADQDLEDATRALALVETLANPGDAISDARIWTLAADICLDQGHPVAGRKALDRAIELDPENEALLSRRRLLREN